MAMKTDQIKLPVSVATEIVNKAKDTSTIASLSPSTPQIFSDADYLVFNGKSEAEVVAEGAVKGSYEQTVDSVVAKRFKVQTTTRVTSELQWADEDNQLQIIRSIQADQAAALGRALDYVIYHAINPKAGTVLSGFNPLSTSAVQVIAGDDDISNVDALADALNDSYDINGVALSKTWASRLRKLRVPSTGMRFYPEIPLNLQAGSLDGITAATSGTVNGRLATTPDEGARVHGRLQPHQVGHGPRPDQRDHRLRRSGPDRRGPEGAQPDRIPHRGDVRVRRHRPARIRGTQNQVR